MSEFSSLDMFCPVLFTFVMVCHILSALPLSRPRVNSSRARGDPGRNLSRHQAGNPGWDLSTAGWIDRHEKNKNNNYPRKGASMTQAKNTCGYCKYYRFNSENKLACELGTIRSAGSPCHQFAREPMVKPMPPDDHIVFQLDREELVVPLYSSLPCNHPVGISLTYAELEKVHLTLQCIHIASGRRVSRSSFARIALVLADKVGLPWENRITKDNIPTSVVLSAKEFALARQIALRMGYGISISRVVSTVLLLATSVPFETRKGGPRELEPADFVPLSVYEQQLTNEGKKNVKNKVRIRK